MDPDKRVVYVRWRDASHGLSEIAARDADLADLHEVGFLFAETEEHVTLSIESQDGAETTRLWLTIPRVNIVEIREANFEKFLRWIKRVK